MTREEFYNAGIIKINEIHQIFKDYYTEERVDLRNVISLDTFIRESRNDNDSFSVDIANSPFILVHFPEVTITNEYNDSVNIKDLWAKVYLTFKGTIRSGFLLNRSHYYKSHWNSDYMHSHCPGIPKGRISDFLSPCLGTGPIRDTIHSLVHSYDELLWQLFCRELEVYVGIESISGGPYRRIKNIGISANRRRFDNEFYSMLNFNYNASTIPLDYIKKFIIYVIKSGALKYNFNGTSYSIAMSHIDYYLVISNLFIEWYNEAFNEGEVTISYNNLLGRGILHKVDIIDNKMYYNKANGANGDTSSPFVLRFKDRDIYLNIEEDTTESISQSYNILEPHIAISILRNILAVINLRYGRIEETNNNTLAVKLKLSI